MRGVEKIGVCAFACILTPSPFGHSPYIPCRNTGGEVEMYSSFAFAPILYRIPRHAAGYGRGRGGLPLSLPLPVLFNPPVTTCHLLYILLGKTPRNATGHGKGGGEYPTKLRRDKTVQSDTFNLSLPQLPAILRGAAGEKEKCDLSYSLKFRSIPTDFLLNLISTYLRQWCQLFVDYIGN